jgi:hypothetical protein
MPPVSVRYPCPDLSTAQQALATVAQGSESSEAAGIASSAKYFDTFDWRLYQAGLALLSQAGRAGSYLTLTDLDGTPKLRLRHHEEPGFVWDLPAGPLHDAIAPLVEMRRLLPMVALSSSSNRFAR